MVATEQVQPISFRAGALQDRLAVRGNVNLSAKRDLGRYYDLLESALGSIALESPEEVELLATALVDRDEQSMTVDDARILHAKIEARCTDRGVDPKLWRPFIARLRRMPLLSLVALVDAVERYLALPEQDGDGMRLVGLLQ